jgi:hypothetical protein
VITSHIPTVNTGSLISLLSTIATHMLSLSSIYAKQEQSENHTIVAVLNYELEEVDVTPDNGYDSVTPWTMAHTVINRMLKHLDYLFSNSSLEPGHDSNASEPPRPNGVAKPNHSNGCNGSL